jgi:general secretion pathway protein K
VTGSARCRRRSPERRHGRDARGQRGIVLIAALWLMVLIAALAGSAIHASRTDQQIGRNAVEAAQARALAEAGITYGIAKLLERGAGDPWPIDGTPRRIRYAGAEIDVAIQDELGKVDINVASEQTLRALFVAAGIKEGDAERLADIVADWRDGDDETHPNGLERTAYEAQGYRYGPRNAPIESVAELEQLTSIERALVRHLAPAVTVHSRQPFIDPRTAPRLSREATTDRAGERSDRSGDSTGPLTSDITDLSGRTYTMSARLSTDAFEHVAIVRFTGRPAQPFEAQGWQ